MTRFIQSIVHDYVELDIVWNTAQYDVPPLIAQFEAYLAYHPPQALP